MIALYFADPCCAFITVFIWYFNVVILDCIFPFCKLLGMKKWNRHEINGEACFKEGIGRKLFLQIFKEATSCVDEIVGRRAESMRTSKNIHSFYGKGEASIIIQSKEKLMRRGEEENEGQSLKFIDTAANYS